MGRVVGLATESQRELFLSLVQDGHYMNNGLSNEVSVGILDLIERQIESVVCGFTSGEARDSVVVQGGFEPW